MHVGPPLLLELAALELLDDELLLLDDDELDPLVDALEEPVPDTDDDGEPLELASRDEDALAPPIPAPPAPGGAIPPASSEQAA